MGGKQSSPFFVAGSIIHSVILTRQAERARTKVQQQQQQRRDSRLKPRQSLTSGEVTHHASFRQSISGDAATFSCLSPSEAEADVKSPQNPLFFPLIYLFVAGFSSPLSSPNSASVVERKFRRESCVRYHRRETDAAIQAGSKRSGSVFASKTRDEFLRGRVSAILVKNCDASPVVRVSCVGISQSSGGVLVRFFGGYFHMSANISAHSSSKSIHTL